MEHFDLVLVRYNHEKIAIDQEVCIAPAYELHVGDRVETEWGKGEVVKLVYSCESNEVYQIFKEERNLRKVLAVIKPLDYKEYEDGLSAQ